MSKAMYHYNEAANNGNSAALFSIGECYYYGHGVEQDYEVAIGQYMKASALGFNEATYQVAHMYENGQGVAQDYTQAMHWYAKCSACRDAIARCKYCKIMCQSGSNNGQ